MFASAKCQYRFGPFTPGLAVAAFPGNRYMARSATIGRSLSIRVAKAASGRTWLTKTLVRERAGRDRLWASGGLPSGRR